MENFIKKMKKTNIVGITLMSVLVFLLVAVLITGITYAYWQKNYSQTDTNEINSGCFSFQLSESGNSINLQNTYPMTETEALSKSPYSLSITNNCSIDMNYNVTLNTNGSSVLEPLIDFELVDESNNVTGPSLVSSQKKYDDYTNYEYTDANNNTFTIANSYILTTGSLKAATMNEDNTLAVKAGESKSYALYLWVDESVEDPSTMNQNFEAKILVTSTTSSSILNKSWKLTNDENNNGIADIGDLITFDTESFYVISNDGTNIKALAQYNLYVGGTYDNSTSTYTAYGAEATGIQDSTMLGYVSVQDLRNGGTAFSTDEKKGINYSDYTGSIVEGYVNTYKTKLELLGATINNASLITKEELETLGCSSSNESCTLAPTFIFSTSYWTMSSYDTSSAWRINKNGKFYYDIYYYNPNNFGVRPVITISADEL